MTHKSSSKPEIHVVASIITSTLTRNQLYGHEPLLQEEKELIWKSWVLIPFTITKITHVFSGPFPDINTNVARVESQKRQFRKDQSLFDLIQISRVGPTYNQNMLLVALHFWEVLMDTFQLRYGMLTPTIFLVASITGLRPTGEVFDPFVDIDDIIGFNSKRASFTNIITDHFDEATTEVSDEDNVTFLSLWNEGTKQHNELYSTCNTSS
ncbi:hypothetical protein KIW84_063684 [Lathyrus oleraceus]|uniref:Aminotransferase-like plant mobile domain-containing protein n=1 Tax=Pisum sativum TaxID=3888 RepID=A0A9D4W894_PEA|nr:hypothetical protein KIW84_063684 [Pisum sativum]